jgi:hypothetical protein
MIGAMAEDPLIEIDRQARFNDLFDRHYAAVRAYVARRSRTTGAVDDVLSETFLVAWRRVERAYEITGAGHSYPSYRMTLVLNGALGEYHGVQGTTWSDPPILPPRPHPGGQRPAAARVRHRLTAVPRRLQHRDWYLLGLQHTHELDRQRRADHHRRLDATGDISPDGR